MTGQSRPRPVDGARRIDVLDVLRGFAILGIFYMNVPYMASNVVLMENDVRSVGWTVPDQFAWATVQLLLDGTQRGLLEMLFGAGMIILAGKAMTPDGPVAVADSYFRRNLWLLSFGMFNIFVLLWPGDILHIYALAALFLFPFRRLSPRWLIVFGMGFTLLSAALGVSEYAERADLVARGTQVEARHEAGAALTMDERATRVEWRKVLDAHELDAGEKQRLATELAARTEGAHLTQYGRFMWNEWLGLAGWDFTVGMIFEAFCAMMIGVALWKWRIIQGGRSAAFYAGLAIAGYGVGLLIRGVGVAELLAFDTRPKTIWIGGELGRLAVTVGHLALINLLMKTVIGAWLLSPLKAAGRTAFSLYFMQQIIGVFILFAPFGLGLFGVLGWADLALVATAVVAFQLIVANIWTRYFIAGPLEWLWRSLSYLKWQKFRRDTDADRLPVVRPASTGQIAANG